MSNAEDRIAVQDVMLRYAEAVDERNMAQYRACFADDVDIVGFAEAPIKGGDAWTDFVTEALKAFGPTQHMLGPMLATIDGDNASCRTDVQALHYMADAPDTTLILWATYKTNMARTGDGWKIVRHELVPRGTRIEKNDPALNQG